jgi:UDP-glucose 4-epimerase
MRWLITGGAGFIGSHVVDEIVRRGRDEVVVIDNFFRGNREHLAQHMGNEAVKIIDSDVRDEASVTSALEGVDIVLHLAARSNVIGSEHYVRAACETNVTGTVNVLSAALRAGVPKVVFSSSREVYGDPQSLPVNENAALAPKNLYGASKMSGEVYCSIFRQRGLDVRVLRLSNVYGPRDCERVIPLWLERARLGMPLEVFGGRQILDLIWIERVVEALLQAALMPTLSVPVNVGSGQGVPILALAERLIQETGSNSAVEILAAREQEVVGYVADISSLRDLLGIEPSGDPLAYLPRLIGDLSPALK